MKAQGKIESITKPIRGGGYMVTVRIDALPEGLDGKLLDVTMVEHKSRRSNDANALMWACIGEIARVVKKEPFDIYLDELAKYGKYTYVVVNPEAVESMMKMWRECKIVGEIDISEETECQKPNADDNTYTKKCLNKPSHSFASFFQSSRQVSL